MTANKHQKVRAALCWNKEIVALAREHNNANVLSLPARFISIPQAIAMVDTYINTALKEDVIREELIKCPVCNACF